MPKNIKQFSINDIQMFRKDEDVDFMHVKIWALAEGNNSHKNPISLEVLQRDAETILGKFIIAKFDKMSSDVTSHVPDQSILGYIIPNQEVVFDEKDGKKFIVVDGLISKIYATDVVKMFRNGIGEREVSCEFSCNESEIEDEYGNKEILAFQIHGITLLGLKYHASCEGAEIKIMKFAKEFSNKPTLKEFAKKRTKKFNKEAEMTKTKKTFAVDIENLWSVIYNKIEARYPDKEWGSIYRIYGIYEEGEQKFAVIYRKDETQKYKLNFTATDGDIELSEDLIAVEEKFEESGEVKMFESVGEDKFKIFEKMEDDIIMAESTVEEEPAKEEEKEMGCEDKALSEDESEKEEKEDEEKPKEFSLDSYVNVGALAVLLEQENEANKKLADKVMKEMSADEIVMEFVKISKELAELKEFKANLENEQKTKKLFSIMAQAKERLTTETFVKLYEEGKSLELAELDGFNNKVKAFVDENIEPKTEDNEIMTFASSDMTQLNNEELDVFEKIKRK